MRNLDEKNSTIDGQTPQHNIQIVVDNELYFENEEEFIKFHQ